MLGLPVRYFLKHPVTTVAHLAADPRQVWMTIQDEYAAVREERGPQCQYDSDGHWERRFTITWVFLGRAGSFGVPDFMA